MTKATLKLFSLFPLQKDLKPSAISDFASLVLKVANTLFLE